MGGSLGNRGGDRSHVAWLVAVVLVAFICRAALVKGGVPHVDFALRGDEGNYFGLAKSFLERGSFAENWPWIRPPIYPLILAGLLAVGGGNVYLAQLFQAAVGAASAGAIYLIALRELGPREARLAGTLSALDPTAPLQAQYLFAEGLATFFALVAALMTLKGLRPRGSVIWFLLAGACLGLSLLTRASGALFAVSLALWLMLRRGWPIRERVVQAVSLVVALCLVLLPWTLRNWQAYHRFIPLDTTLGVNLYQHNSDLTRTQVYAELIKIPNPGDRDVYAIAKAMHWIVRNPERFAERALERLSHAWTADRYTEWDIGLRTRYPAVASWLSALNASVGTLWFLAAVFFGALGIGLTRGSSYRSMVLLLAVTYMATTVFVESVFRYRLALVPFLIPLVAVVPFRPRLKRGILLWGLVGAACLALSLPALLPAMPRDLEANVLHVTGRAAGLVGYHELSNHMYRRALAIEERSDFLLSAALEASRQGKLREAEELLKAARSRWPDDPRVAAIAAQLARAWGLKVADGPYGMVGLWAEAWAWDHLPLNPRSSLAVGADDLG